MMQLEERLHNRTVHPTVHLRDARLDDQEIHTHGGWFGEVAYNLLCCDVEESGLKRF